MKTNGLRPSLLLRLGEDEVEGLLGASLILLVLILLFDLDLLGVGDVKKEIRKADLLLSLLGCILENLLAVLLDVFAGHAGILHLLRETAEESFGLTLDERGRLGDGGYRTDDAKVFACGDLRRGASLVVWAIAEGRACARAVDAFLEGYTNL